MAAPKTGLRALLGVCLLAASVASAGPAGAAVPTGIRDVAADGETVPVGTTGDSVDDPAIWLNRSDPARSIVIGNDKGDALEVYDLAGNRLQRIAEGHGNVDVRHDFPIGAVSVDVAAATRGGLRIYRIDPATRTLTSITDGASIPTNSGEGLCMYHSPTSDRFYVFQITRAGAAQQWWIRDADGDGLVDGSLVRSFSVGSESEGCVADDGLGHLYIAEEDVGIWKYGAEPGDGATRSLVDSVGATGRLVADVEGLSIVYQPDGTGFLLASAQNVANPTANYYAVYQRQGGNAFVDAFRITSGTAADGCSRTDGIDAVAANLGPGFPSGLFVCQDDSNTTPGGSGNQDFKFVRLEKILTGVDPGPDPGPDVTPPDTVITSGPSGSVTTASATLAFDSTEANSTFACFLDGAAPTGCTSPLTYTGLALGEHRFEVAATDLAGNTDGTPAVRTWTRTEATPGPLTLTPTDDARVENNNPDTEFGTATTLASDLSPLKETFLRFEVPATETAVTGARLRLFVTDPTDNGPKVYESDPDWSEAFINWNNRPTRTPVVVADRAGLAKGVYVEWDVSPVVTAGGTYSFVLVADSKNGVSLNAKEAAANRPQLVVDVAAAPPGPDTAPPQTTITAGPSGTVTSSTASFSFTADEAATFACSLDTNAPEFCTSPKTYPGLADGPHHFEVRATDTAGNPDTTPAMRGWTIDTTTPPPAPDTIATLAGTGVRGAAGDGGPATSAQLSAPRTTAVDAAGNTFVADTENHRIRRISAAGVITTIAGTGTAGFSGDGGPATAARLDSPHGVAVDGAGNVYVADSPNHRIRRIAPGGTITTVAGTGGTTYSGDGIAATSASLAFPKGVEVAPDGSLYVGDANHHRVRRFTVGGLISTVAGTGTAGYSGDGGQAGAARLNFPRNIAFGPDGSFYIADDSNFAVRKVSPTGVITTVAGTGVAGFSGDGGPATAAQLRRVRDVAVDAAGAVYIADEENHRIRRVSPAGIMSTFAGTGTSGFSGDGGAPASARVAGPRGVTVAPSGEILIADTGNHRIRRVS